MKSVKRYDLPSGGTYISFGPATQSPATASLSHSANRGNHNSVPSGKKIFRSLDAAEIEQILMNCNAPRTTRVV